MVSVVLLLSLCKCNWCSDGLGCAVQVVDVRGLVCLVHGGIVKVVLWCGF